MSKTKIFSFIGMERCDIPVYLSNLLTEKKVRVLVIDNSLSHDLFSSLKKAEEKTSYVENGRIVYMKNKAYSPTAFEKFDSVIVYHGFNMDKELVEMSDKLIIAIDYFKSTMELFNDYIDVNWINEVVENEKKILVYRDKLNTKVSEIYILREMGLSRIDEEYIISFDETDLALYQNFIYNGKQSPKGISGELKTFLSMLNDDMYGKKRKKMNIEEEDEA